jgi:mannose-1-phosphate guanylyltransferase
MHSKNGQMDEFQEKPTMKFNVSTGIYLMEPKILDLIPDNVPFGFDDLMYEMMHRKLAVNLYPHDGLWLDIGREDDFRLAQNTFMEKHRVSVLGC